jgi:hypothetical protein
VLCAVCCRDNVFDSGHAEIQLTNDPEMHICQTAAARRLA